MLHGKPASLDGMPDGEMVEQDTSFSACSSKYEQWIGLGGRESYKKLLINKHLDTYIKGGNYTLPWY
jgi:hypothetical protein